jgi:glucose/arabinose dehydrogenase
MGRFESLSRPLLVITIASALLSSAEAQHLSTTVVASNLAHPVYVTSEPGNASRLYVVQQQGTIKLIKNGVLLPTAFLDLTPIVGSSGAEQGLLGLAFHPSYASNGKFYVAYTNPTGLPVVREYLVSANPDKADPASFTTILGPLTHPQLNHNGGNLQFGPDGYLYYGMGDGGDGDDTGPGHDPNTGNAQSLATYLGKMLRIDVDDPPSYVPATNPFATSSFPLIWAYGLRNPWRWSFDRKTGDLYIADVGQDAWEEIDFQPASSHGGENYGWRCMEASHCTGLTGCTCNSPSLVLPIFEYGHVNARCAIIGGYVYRGSAITGLAGAYFFADYCSGHVWSFRYVNGQVTNLIDRTVELTPQGSSTLQGPGSFGEDADGELYIVEQAGGRVLKIQKICPAPETYCVDAPNSTGSGAVMRWSGTSAISMNDLKLMCAKAPPHVQGNFFYGQGETQIPFGNGFRCIAHELHRLPLVETNAAGNAVFTFDVHAPPAVIDAGSTWNFQYWYRDASAGGALFNESNALSVTFCP